YRVQHHEHVRQHRRRAVPPGRRVAGPGLRGLEPGLAAVRRHIRGRRRVLCAAESAGDAVRGGAMTRVETPQTRCRSAVRRADITPPVGIYHRRWGAALHDRATGVHRRLLATALWLGPLEGGLDQARLVLALDHCLFEASVLASIRTRVCRAVPLT